MPNDVRTTPLIVALIFCIGSAFVANSQDVGLQIEAKPLPGQLDLLQGTAIQLGGKPSGKGRQPEAYHWEIVEGDGGRLLKADRAEAIFQAPMLSDHEMELFIIQLTAMYGSHAPARVQLHVRVHKELPEPREQLPPEEEIKQKMREQASTMADRTSSRSRSSTVVVRHGPSWGFGYHWGWGWPVHYPIYVPIVVPPPGGNWEPGIGDWDEPIAIPYDDMVTNFPEGIADDYLPQDFPYAEELPPSAMLGDGPSDLVEPDLGFIDIPQIDPPMAEPGFGGFDDLGGGFDVPMIEPDFGFDDFGW
jgi:hypothetical protein